MKQEQQKLKGIDLPPFIWAELGGLALLLAEVMWTSLWYQFLAKPEGSWGLAVVIFILTIVGSHYLARGLYRPGSVFHPNRIVFVLWILFCLLISLRFLFYAQDHLSLVKMIGQTFTTLGQGDRGTREFWHLLIMTILIWRGVMLARKPLTIGNNVGGFQLGAAAFLVYGFTFGLQKSSQSLIAFFGFLFFALIGLTFARIAYLGESRGGRLPQFNARWLSGIALAALAVAVLSMLVGWLVKGDVSAFLAASLAAVLSLLGLIFFSILAPVLSLILTLAYRFGSIIFATFNIGDSQAVESIKNPIPNSEESLTALNGFINSSKVPLLFGILVLIVIITLISLSWRPWERRRPKLEQDEDIGGSNPRRKTSQPFDGINLPQFIHPRRILAAARIRRVYAQLMELSNKLGKPRPPAITPLEFLPDLQVLFPNEMGNLATITNAYLRIRYGELPETNQEVQDVLDAWKRVNARGKHLYAEQKAMQRKRPKK